MRVALVTKAYDVEKLEAVKNEMLTLGTPTINAVWMECYGHWVALEGCHRLRACLELGLVPEINEIDYSDEMCSTIEGYDGEEDYPISEICDDSHRATVLNFTED
jgi:hypothetical protein